MKAQNKETNIKDDDTSIESYEESTISEPCQSLLDTITDTTLTQPKTFTLLRSENLNEKPLIVTVIGGGDKSVTYCLHQLKQMYLAENSETKAEKFVFGFDTESDRGKVASVQLSTRFLSVVFLLQKMYNNNGSETNSTKLNFPIELQKFLEDARILKTGVGVSSDAKNLRRSFNVMLRGDVDLSLLAVQQGVLSGSFISLKEFAKRLIGGMTYTRTHRGVQWSKLDVQRHESMIHYAAMDSFVGYRCTQILASYLCVQGENKSLYEWLSGVSKEMNSARLAQKKKKQQEQNGGEKVSGDNGDEEDEKLLRRAEKELSSEEQERLRQNRRRYMEIANADGSRMKSKLQDKKRKREREVQLDNGLSDALNLLKGIYNSGAASSSSSSATEETSNGDEADGDSNDNNESNEQQKQQEVVPGDANSQQKKATPKQRHRNNRDGNNKKKRARTSKFDRDDDGIQLNIV